MLTILYNLLHFHNFQADRNVILLCVTLACFMSNVPWNVFRRCASDPIDLLFLLTTCLTNQLVDVANHSGNTPLHLAASMGATVCCLHLLQVFIFLEGRFIKFMHYACFHAVQAVYNCYICHHVLLS